MLVWQQQKQKEVSNLKIYTKSWTCNLLNQDFDLETFVTFTKYSVESLHFISR